MDKVRFSCPRCQTMMQTGAEKIGYDVACPHCAHRFRLIESAGASSSSGSSQPAGVSGDAPTLPPGRTPVGLDRPPTASANPARTEFPQSPPKSPVASWGEAPVIGRAPAPRPGFSCPYCQTQSPPIWKSEVSTIGWIVFAILLVTTCVFCWVGLFIRDRYRVCSKCRIRLG